MSANTRLALLLAVLGLAVPATASAAPRAAADPTPVAHQEDWGDDEGWEETDPVQDVTDDVDGAVEDLGDAVEDPWGDDEGTEEDWGDDDLEPAAPVIEYATGKTVAGRDAMLRRNGKAAIPRSAPKQVKLVIAAANKIVGKPYKWGGGHAKLVDRGYDCSGTVSYALIRSGLLTAPLVSGSFAKWGRADAGRWITIYANKGHVYMEVAGLRLDTSPMGDDSGKGPRWRPAIGKRKGFHVRHISGL